MLALQMSTILEGIEGSEIKFAKKSSFKNFSLEHTQAVLGEDPARQYNNWLYEHTSWRVRTYTRTI
ncbi:hypothetical protein QTP88_012969 [Uroleucon formosanum]